MGTGIDRIYPARHRELAHRIARMARWCPSCRWARVRCRSTFKRNRIVAGLARGVLVVEAARQSGSLITARLAGECGREVFAIPGSIHSPLSRGCHALIRQGAKLVETAQDITDELGGSPLSRPASRASAAPPLPAHPVLEAMGFDPLHLDAIQARSGLDIADLQTQLVELELASRRAARRRTLPALEVRPRDTTPPPPGRPAAHGGAENPRHARTMPARRKQPDRAASAAFSGAGPCRFHAR